MREDSAEALFAKFAGLTEKLEKNLRMAVRMAAEEAAAEAKRTTAFQDRSSVLRNSIEPDGPFGSFAAGDLTATVSAGAFYASYVERGTKPHEIRPKRATQKRPRPSLRWPVEGGFMFAKVVHHPGTAPRPFLEPAVEAIMPRLHGELIPDAIELSFIQIGFSPG